MAEKTRRPGLFHFALVALFSTFLVAVGLTPGQAADAVSVADGVWSDPQVWAKGLVPGTDDLVLVSHEITLDVSTDIAGLDVDAQGVLVFDPTASVTLTSTANVLVHGRLSMRPKSPSIEHELHFAGIDESRFVGGGMAPIASDVGLWVRDAGVWDAAGASKTSWLNLAGGVSEGDPTITLESVPTGWRVGDELAIAPTLPQSAGDAVATMGFDEVAILAIDGATVVLDQPLRHDHPKVDGRWTAEVMNLTRNVNVTGEGDGSADAENNGRTHVNLHTMVPQQISYVGLRHVSPLQPATATEREPVLGRWGLHFHHAGDGSRGTLVEGVVVRNFGGHAFTPHHSNGITIRDAVAYDGWGDAYWYDLPEADAWDESNNTDDLLIDRAIAAALHSDGVAKGFELSGFLLAGGRNNAVVNSVAVGVEGNVNASGFHWPSKVNLVPNTWTFEDNVAHNNRVNGSFVWQNTGSGPHLVDRFVAYNNGRAGIDHGAYVNAYHYRDVELIGNERSIEQHANPHSKESLVDAEGYVQRFEQIRTDAPIHIGKHSLPGSGPTLYRDCDGVPFVEVKEAIHPGQYDFVECGLEPEDFELLVQLEGSRIRVQRSNGTAFQIDDRGRVSDIDAFYTGGGSNPGPTPDPSPDPVPDPTPHPDPAPDPSPMPDPTPVPDPFPDPVPTGALFACAFDVPSSGWPSDLWSVVHSSGGDGQVTTAGGVLTAESASDGFGAVANMAPAADMDITLTQQFAGGSSTWRLWLRSSGDWVRNGVPTSGYEISRTSTRGQARLYRLENGRRKSLGSFAWPADTQSYRLRAIVEGDRILVKVWRAPEEEPAAWALDVRDGTVTGVGTIQTSLIGASTRTATAILSDLVVVEP